MPDLNQAIAQHRSALSRALEWRDPAAIMRAATILNGCLSEDFKLSFVPWTEFKARTAPRHVVDCPFGCKDENGKRGQHPTYPPQYAKSKWPAGVRAVLREREATPYITCPKFKKKIWLDDPNVMRVTVPTNIYDPDLPAPMPPPHESLSGRTFYAAEYDKWAAALATIIEDRCRLFRASYSVGADPDEAD